MKLSQRLIEERAFLAKKLGDDIICEQCGACLADYASRCTAELSDACPGFMTIEDAKEEFSKSAR
jgi:hypothetical protein